MSRSDRAKATSARGGNADTSTFVAMPAHMRRPPGKTQLTLHEALKAATPSGYTEQSGLEALGQMLGSAVVSVTGYGEKALERNARALRERESRKRHVPIRVPPWVMSQLSHEQKAAVELVSKGQSFVLLGKAGTGKTFTLVEAILAGLHRAGVQDQDGRAPSEAEGDVEAGSRARH